MNENQTTGGVVIHQMTGEVVGADKSSTMQVHGGGGGGTGHIVGGHGYTTTSPVSVTSTTTIHDQIFLRDSAGKERSFQLSNFNVACRDGHKLSILWAKRKGKERGPFFRVINHTTNEQYTNVKGIRAELTPHWIMNLLFVSFGIYYTFYIANDGIGGDFDERIGLLLSITAVPIGSEIFRNIIGYIRTKRFMKSDALKKVMLDLDDA